MTQFHSSNIGTLYVNVPALKGHINRYKLVNAFNSKYLSVKQINSYFTLYINTVTLNVTYRE